MRKACLLVCLLALTLSRQAEPAQKVTYVVELGSTGTRPKPAQPTPEQVAWHDYEMGMFIHFAPNTWQNLEYDDLSTPLDKINPEKLDTDQWVHVAKDMGAGYIVFVVKHVGGFCMWQTDTTDYSIGHTAWRGGKGDVLADLRKSCDKANMPLGVYLSPADRKHGADVGGKCKTPETQAAYNELYRTQLTEVLSKYGPMVEVWFDGSNVVPVGDILAKYAPKAMIFQGPHATIRWVGNEEGEAPYPAWNGLSEKAAKSGVATAKDGNPTGPCWLPNEVDARMRRDWFWNAGNADTLKSLDKLMDMYDKSVGRGAVLLLNNTPDPSGLIPQADAKRAAEFGAEIKRRFAKSIAETSHTGAWAELKLPHLSVIDHVVIMEDITSGENVREYVVEGTVDGKEWTKLCEGTAVGHKKIDHIKPTPVSAVRLHCLNSPSTPVIRKLTVYNTLPTTAK